MTSSSPRRSSNVNKKRSGSREAPLQDLPPKVVGTKRSSSTKKKKKQTQQTLSPPMLVGGVLVVLLLAGVGILGRFLWNTAPNLNLISVQLTDSHDALFTDVLNFFKNDLNQFYDSEFVRLTTVDRSDPLHSASVNNEREKDIGKIRDSFIEFQRRLMQLGPIEAGKIDRMNEETRIIAEEMASTGKQRAEEYLKANTPDRAQGMAIVRDEEWTISRLHGYIKIFSDSLDGMCTPDIAPASAQDKILLEGLRLMQEGCQILAFAKDNSSANGCVRSLSNKTTALIAQINKMHAEPADNGAALQKYSHWISSNQLLLTKSVEHISQFAQENSTLKTTLDNFHAASAEFATASFGVQGTFDANKLDAIASVNDRAITGLKSMMRGIHKYHNTHSVFPSVPLASDSNTGLSWRVHILPFLEQENLYQKFHLDEPWNSPHNIKLIPEMPEIFAVGTDVEPGKTRFHAFAGPNSLLSKPKPSLRSCLDGTDNVMGLVLAGPSKATEWTKPEGIEFDIGNVLGSLGEPVGGKYYVALFSGKAMSLSASTPPEIIGWLIDPGDGNDITDKSRYLILLK